MRTIAIAWACVTLLSCSSTPPPEPARYLMRSAGEVRSEEVEPGPRIGLRRVRVAPYLRVPGLVLETEQNEVRSARYHQWAEPLEHGLRSLLRGELSAALGRDVDDDPMRMSRWDYIVDVAVDQLHGTAAGEALLVAAWRVTSVESAAELSSSRFTRREPLARTGYAALAEAEIALVRQLAASIAESLRALPPPDRSSEGEGS